MTPEETLLKEAYLFAKQHHEKDNTGHDFSHVQRVYANVCHCLEEDDRNEGRKEGRK